VRSVASQQDPGDYAALSTNQVRRSLLTPNQLFSKPHPFLLLLNATFGAEPYKPTLSTARVAQLTSAPPRGLDGGDVDFLHRHHRLEGALCLTATSRKRVG
jgi:hypothetical protein